MNDRLLQIQLGGGNFLDSTYGIGAYQAYDRFLNGLGGKLPFLCLLFSSRS